MTSSVANELALADGALREGRIGDAIAILEQGVRRHPGDAGMDVRLAELHGRLGVSLSMAGRLQEAAQAFAAALARDPGFIDARINLGMVRTHLGAPEQGAALMRQALCLMPDHTASWQMLASVAYLTGNEAFVDVAAGRALAIASANGAALALRALVLRRKGRIGDAFRAARRAVVLDPREGDMLAVGAMALRDIGQSEAAVGLFRRAVAANPRHADARSAFIMCLNYASSASPADLLVEARQWERWHAPTRRGPSAPSTSKTGPLRVGLVSGDFRTHAVGYFLSGALPHLDRTRAETICFATTRGGDAVTATIRAAATGWHDISTIGDDQAFDLVTREKVDILVDLSGHTGGSRLSLFALKPAPVQAAWIGYFGTTGLSAIDWLIADRQLIPDGDERWFSEKVLRLPDSYVCYAPPSIAPEVAPPPSDRTGYVTFGSCNALAKVTPPTVAAWARILKAVPGARLLLKNGAFDAAIARASVLAAFAEHGVDHDRIALEGWTAYGQFLDTYGRIDVALDPFPFCGGLSTVETLWMGVPLVTLEADRFAGRQSLSYLTTIGHAELCAEDEARYVRIAVALGRDAEARRSLRSRLRQDMASSPLMNGPRFARNLEAAFETMAGRR